MSEGFRVSGASTLGNAQSLRPFNHPHSRTSNQLPLHRSIRPSTSNQVFLIHPHVNPSLYKAIHPSTDPSIHPCVTPSFHPSIYASIHPSIHPSTHPSIHPPISIYPTVFIHPLIPTGSILPALPPIPPSLLPPIQLSMCNLMQHPERQETL